MNSRLSVAGVDDSPDATVVWRYMSLGALLGIVIDKQSRFSSLKQLSNQDRYEGMSSNDKSGYQEMCEGVPGYGAQFSFAEDQLADESFLRCNFFVNCWHVAENESLAMWKIYSRESGVAVRSTIGRLRKAFASSKYQVQLRLVKYQDPQTLSEHGLTKKPFYSFENELRAYVHEGLRSLYKEGPTLFIPTDPALLIESVYVEPTMPWLSPIVKSVLNKCGLDVPVCESGI